MCLLIYKPPGKKITKEAFERGFRINSDGGGFAWVENGKVFIRKPFWSVDEMWKEYVEHEDHQMIVHFRITTHGGTSADNCHPFDAGGGWAMGHNGMIALASPQTGESDTRAYIREFIAPITNVDPDFIKQDAIPKIMERHIGHSKLVFINGKGEHLIVNEAAGTWDEGIWYSNCSFRAARSTATTTTQHNNTYNAHDTDSTRWRSTNNGGFQQNMGGSSIFISKVPPYWDPPKSKVIPDSRKSTQQKPHSHLLNAPRELTGTLFSSEAFLLEDQVFRCCFCGEDHINESKIVSFLDPKGDIYCKRCWLDHIIVTL